MQITRPGMDGKVFTLGQCVLQIVQRGGQDGNGGTAQPHVDQIIPQAQIQQFTLPLYLFGEFFCLGVPGVHGIGQGSGGIGKMLGSYLRPLYDPAAFGFDPGGDGQNTA